MFSAFKPVRPLRFAFFSTAWGLVVLGSFLLFGGLFGDDSVRGQIELACTKAKLEAMWGMPLPADLEVVGSIPKSGVASAGWDIKELGCSGAIYPTATLKLRE
jgi:hypothetical protein